MAKLSFVCHVTNNSVSTGIDVENAQLLARRWDETLRLRCPHCGQTHEMKFRDAYLQFAVSADILNGPTDREVEALAERMIGFSRAPT